MTKTPKIRALANDNNDKLNYSKITDKQWSVYYYLLSISLWNYCEKENHRFVDKKEINISSASKMLSISRPTFYRAIDQLEVYNLIYTTPESRYYYLTMPDIYAEVNPKIISFLIKFRRFVGIDLLRTYLILKKYFIFTLKEGKKKTFVKKEMVDLLGHNKRDTSYFGLVEIYLTLLEKWGLIELKRETISGVNGKYICYTLTGINDDSEILDSFKIDEAGELTAIGIPQESYEEFKKLLRL